MNKNTKNKITDLDHLSLDVYGDKEFAQSYANRIEYNSHNALYERPATISLIPDVKGKKVLDAGCGPGNYSDWFTNKGAIVTAIDYSDEMVRLTTERLGDNISVYTANLNMPLEFKDDEFDLILSSMVVHYIRDWNNLFSEFNRVLKKNGVLVFSMHHPFMDFSFHPDSNYFETTLVNDEWPSYNIEMKFYRRPLGDIFNILKVNDFMIDEVLEPQPLEECKEKFPDAYKILSTRPWFICFRAIKVK